MTISIRTSITGVKSLPNALQITRALRDTFSAVDEHKMLDNLSNWPYFHYFKNEDDEFIGAVSYGYDFGKEVSPEEFVATVFPNGLPTRSKRKKGPKNKKRATNKATIFFTDGTQYTIKDFEEVSYIAGGNLSFYTIKKQNSTFSHVSNMIEMLVEDIESVAVLGMHKSFLITNISDFSASLSGPDFEATTTHFAFKV